MANVKQQQGLILIVLLVIGGLVVYFNMDSSSPINPDDGQINFCGSDTSPDLVVDAYDIDNPSTAITETLIYRKVGSKTWTEGQTGATLSNLEPNQEYEFVLGINTSDAVDNAYGETFTHTIKCQEKETIEYAMYNDEVETSLQATFYNKDGDASAQTFSAGDEYVVSLRLKAGSDEYFGNPTLDNPNVLVLKLNQTAWDTPNSVYLADGTELTKISVPQRYNGQASGYNEYAYVLPAVTDKEITIFLDLDADDSNAPTEDGTAYIYAGGYFIDDTGEVSTGVEDEEGVAVATDSPDTVPLDFSA